MGSVTIRNLPARTHQALKIRAKENGRSCEAEMRLILEQAIIPPQKNAEKSFAQRLLDIGSEASLSSQEWQAFEEHLKSQRALWQKRML